MGTFAVIAVVFGSILAVYVGTWFVYLMGIGRGWWGK